MGQSAEEDFVSKVPVEIDMNCVVLVYGGKLFIEDCLISLKYSFEFITVSL